MDLIFDFIECFTTAFLHTHSWLNWVDEDDQDEVWLERKARRHYVHQRDYIEIRPEAPGVCAKDHYRSTPGNIYTLLNVVVVGTRNNTHNTIQQHTLLNVVVVGTRNNTHNTIQLHTLLMLLLCVIYEPS